MRRQLFTDVWQVAVVLLSLSSCVWAQGRDGIMKWSQLTKEAELQDKGGRTAIFAANVARYRELCSDRPSMALPLWLTPSAKLLWDSRIGSEFAVQQISDFFRGAIGMTGPQTDSRGIWGLYNPWWDAILFLDLRVSENFSPDGDKPAVQVERFVFMSGETLRGEQVEEAESDIRRNTVLPSQDRLSVEIWRVLSKSRKAFTALLPIEGPVSSFAGVIKLRDSVDSKRDVTRIQIRSALRLKEASLILNDPASRVDMKLYRRALIAGTEEELDKTFEDPDSVVLRDTFKEMPYLFRQQFSAYGFLKTGDGTQYVFVNRRLPRLYATVTVTERDGNKVAALEWFDLLQADELLAVWELQKGGRE